MAQQCSKTSSSDTRISSHIHVCAESVQKKHERRRRVGSFAHLCAIGSPFATGTIYNCLCPLKEPIPYVAPWLLRSSSQGWPCLAQRKDYSSFQHNCCRRVPRCGRMESGSKSSKISLQSLKCKLLVSRCFTHVMQ